MAKWTTKSEQIKDKLNIERIDEGEKIAGRLFSDFRDYIGSRFPWLFNYQKI